MTEISYRILKHPDRQGQTASVERRHFVPAQELEEVRVLVATRPTFGVEVKQEVLLLALPTSCYNAADLASIQASSCSISLVALAQSHVSGAVRTACSKCLMAGFIEIPLLQIVYAVTEVISYFQRAFYLGRWPSATCATHRGAKRLRLHSTLNDQSDKQQQQIKSMETICVVSTNG